MLIAFVIAIEIITLVLLEIKQLGAEIARNNRHNRILHAQIPGKEDELREITIVN